MSDTTPIPRLFDSAERAKRPNIQRPEPLPTTPDEVKARGWEQVDVVFITGDAYVDAPSFANGLLARLLEDDGFTVAVLSQPDWNNVEVFRQFGRPRLAFCVSAGNMDSMINHYTANRKVRNDDAYSAGGKIGKRPDRATLVYCQRAREAFPGTPVITGGVEASLRRIAHYDYWSDKVRRSILLDAKADLLIYGMGERPLLEILRRLADGHSIRDMRDVRGVVYRIGKSEDLPEESDVVAHLPSYEEVSYDENAQRPKAEEKARLLERQVEDAYSELDEMKLQLVALENSIATLETEKNKVNDGFAQNVKDGLELDPKLIERDDELSKELDARKAELVQTRDKMFALRNKVADQKKEARRLRDAPKKEAQLAKAAFVKMTQIAYENLNPFCAKTLIQEHGEEAIAVNPPSFPLSEEEMDHVYALPFTRKAHPSYHETIPAVDVVRATVQTHRGCFGGCSFCAITAHQGKFIQSRSESAVLREIETLAKEAGGDYVVSDLNAPTANMYRLGGKQPGVCKSCKRVSCLCPNICPNLNVDHSAYVQLLKDARNLPGVKRVLIASGIRTDLALFSKEFVRELAERHTGGHLKTAPEHVDDDVLRLMNKPSIGNYEQFCDLFESESAAANKEQYCVPYLISGYPGSTLRKMVDVALYLKKHGIRPEQVQDFIPAPFQLGTCAYYTGIDPLTGNSVYVPKTLRERRLQRALLFYYDENFYDDVKVALREAGRQDLIGFDDDSLIPPYLPKSANNLRSSKVRFLQKKSEREQREKDERREMIAQFDGVPEDAREKRSSRNDGGDYGGYRGSARKYGRERDARSSSFESHRSRAGGKSSFKHDRKSSGRSQDAWRENDGEGKPYGRGERSRGDGYKRDAERREGGFERNFVREGLRRDGDSKRRNEQRGASFKRKGDQRQSDNLKRERGQFQPRDAKNDGFSKRPRSNDARPGSKRGKRRDDR